MATAKLCGDVAGCAKIWTTCRGGAAPPCVAVKLTEEGSAPITPPLTMVSERFLVAVLLAVSVTVTSKFEVPRCGGFAAQDTCKGQGQSRRQGAGGDRERIRGSAAGSGDEILIGGVNGSVGEGPWFGW